MVLSNKVCLFTIGLDMGIVNRFAKKFIKLKAVGIINVPWGIGAFIAKSFEKKFGLQLHNTIRTSEGFNIAEWIYEQAGPFGNDPVFDDALILEELSSDPSTNYFRELDFRGGISESNNIDRIEGCHYILNCYFDPKSKHHDYTDIPYAQPPGPGAIFFGEFLEWWIPFKNSILDYIKDQVSVESIVINDSHETGGIDYEEISRSADFTPPIALGVRIKLDEDTCKNFEIEETGKAPLGFPGPSTPVFTAEEQAIVDRAAEEQEYDDPYRNFYGF